MLILCRQNPDLETKPETKTQSGEEEVILCRLCSHSITSPNNQILVESAFSHTFANPPRPGI